MARERDAHVSNLIREGHVQESYDLAYEWQRSDPENLANQRRYHRVLLLTDKQDTLTWFTPKYLQALLKAQKGQDALQAHEATLTKHPELLLESAELSMRLAELAWKGLNHRQALALLKGFDKRFPRDPLIPNAYELIARILHQGLSRTPQALAVYRALHKNHPQHPATQEVAWLLRDHIAEATTPTAPSGPQPAA